MHKILVGLEQLCGNGLSLEHQNVWKVGIAVFLENPTGVLSGNGAQMFERIDTAVHEEGGWRRGGRVVARQLPAAPWELSSRILWWRGAAPPPDVERSSSWAAGGGGPAASLGPAAATTLAELLPVSH